MPRKKKVTEKEFKQQLNLDIIARIKQAAKKGDFSIGEIAREYNVPFQKVRHFCYALANKQGKSMIKSERGRWNME